MRILALMEAHSVTGPAKNLLQFCQWTRSEGAAAGLEITLATTARHPDMEGRSSGFVQAARQLGIPFHVMSERYRFDPQVIRQLKELVEQVRPDIVQTHTVKPHFLVKASGLAKAMPWIAFHHGYTWTTRTMELYNQVDRWSLRSAKRVVTVCQAFVPQLQGRGVLAANLRVLHNSVTPHPTDQAEVDRLRQQYGLPLGTRVLLTVGRFSKEKGYADLIEAFALLQEKTKDWKALWVGDGPERPAIEELARQRGLGPDKVIFAGFHANTAPFFSLATLFALPSHSEGSPNVILEAMVYGVPVVATAVGGTPEVVSHEATALLVPSLQPKALAAALERMLVDESLQSRLREAAKDRALTVFSPQRYRETLLGIYRESLS